MLLWIRTRMARLIGKKCAHSLVVDKVAKADALISVDPVKVAEADAVKVVLVHGLKVVGTIGVPAHGLKVVKVIGVQAHGPKVAGAIGAPAHVLMVVKVIDVPAHGLKVVRTIDAPAHVPVVVKTRADLAKAIEISRGPSAVVPKEY